MITTSSSLTVGQQFFAPLLSLLPSCQFTHSCPVLDDVSWLILCLSRVLQQGLSGRAFLQEFSVRFPEAPSRGAFFQSLKSPRRLQLLDELNAKLLTQVSLSRPDPFIGYPVLQGFDLYAGDGHWHQAAVHDPVSYGIKHPMGHFYGLNLRTHGLIHLTAADQAARLKEHDMRALKRLNVATLRQGAATGRKVLWVWDKAGIDFQQWHRWKQGSGIYLISRVKENMRLEVIGEKSFDPKDPVNQGVQFDQLVSTSQGVMMRRVTYQDPVSGEVFEFVTSEFTLPPGWIAHLYRLRWNIEKVFDQLKNKFGEKKAWASSATAKAAQAQLLCLSHNLLLIFELEVLQPAGVQNQAEDKRRQGRVKKVKTTMAEGKQVLPTLVETLQRCTQHSVKFIRWLRFHLFLKTSCSAALDSLRALYATL